MRDYLSPARNYLGKARAQATLLSKGASKPRVVAMLISATVIALFASGIVALRTMAEQSSQKNTTVETRISPGETSVTQTTTIETDAPAVQPIDESSSQSSEKINTSDTTTSVTVNDQPIEVPKNGSVQKVITNDNGTTQVNVSASSSGTSTNVSTYSTSTSSFNTNTNTSSQNSIFRSP